LLRPLQVHLYLRAAPRALAGLVRLYRLRLGGRHIEFVGLVLGVPAVGAIDTHPHDHQDPVIHARKYAKRATTFHGPIGRSRTPPIVRSDVFRTPPTACLGENEAATRSPCSAKVRLAVYVARDCHHQQRAPTYM